MPRKSGTRRDAYDHLSGIVARISGTQSGHKVKALCQAHADAVFGSQDPPWRHMDAKTQRDIVEEWLRGVTILAHGGLESAEVSAATCMEGGGGA